MAITKQNITTLAELAAFIDDSGFFDSVTFASSIISCYDADANLILKIDGSGYGNIRAYADDTNYNECGFSGGNNWFKCTAYSTEKGIMLAGVNNGFGSSLVASKTNNGKYGVLLPNPYRISDGILTTQYAIAWGDSAPFTGVVFCGAPNPTQTDNQTIFMPIATHAALGEKSYFADAFFLPVSQYRIECVFSDENGVKHVTDGFVCLRDE